MNLRSKLFIFGSQKGNAVLFSLAIASAGIISAMAMIPMFKSARNQISLQNSKSSYESVLQGSLDYTLAGIKNRWCFTLSMLQDPTCNLLHTGNVERILMSLDTVQFIKSFMRPNLDYSGNVLLQRIDRQVLLSQISSAHPLFTLIQTLPPDSVTAIRFEIDRIADVNEPARSREVLLKVKISFLGQSNVQNMFSEAKVAVFPRELNTYALLLPNDLHIGKAAPVTTYDSSITGTAGTSTGLLFQSPVFVNGNIFIPSQKGVSANTGVTFADRVYTAGSIFEGNSIFNSASAGGPSDQRYSNLKNFGGLLGGVEFESQRDAGLDNLSGINLPIQPPKDLFEFCRERNLAKLELRYTDMTRTLVKPVVGNPLALEFTTGGINDLFPQRSIVRRSFHLTGAMSSGIDIGGSSVGDSPVVRLTVELSGINGVAVPQAVIGDIAFNDTLWLKSGVSGPKIGVRLDPIFLPEGDGDPEPNRFRLQLVLSNATSAAFGPMPLGSPPSVAYAAGSIIKISVEPFDLGFNGGVNQRPTSVPTLDRNKVNGGVFKYNGTTFVPEVGNLAIEGWYGCSSMDGTRPECMDSLVTTTDPKEAQKLIPIEGISYAALARACGNLRNFGDSPGQYPAFGGADWSTSFADQADTVWGFTEFDNTGINVNGYYNGTLLLNSTNAGVTPATNLFHVRARINRCLVDSSATTVTGFFVCDTFEIGPRTTPLTIVGTVIANKLVVAPAAITAGIRWSSIYHPQALDELRRLRILQSQDAAGNPTACAIDPNEPIWLPTISMAKSFNYYRCSSSFLRDRADPFKWTSVDPDCGLPPAPAAQYKCKSRVTKVNVKEISRRSQL